MAVKIDFLIECGRIYGFLPAIDVSALPNFACVQSLKAEKNDKHSPRLWRCNLWKNSVLEFLASGGLKNMK